MLFGVGEVIEIDIDLVVVSEVVIIGFNMIMVLGVC